VGKESFKLKNLIFFFVYFFLVLLFFVLIEIGLRLFNYGYNTEPFVKPKYFPEVYVDNYDFLNKYYNQRKNYGCLMRRNIFDSQKATNIVRGFIIGESTPQGFPFEVNNSFAKITEIALDCSEQKDRFEIINVCYSALTSYYVQDVAKKVLKYEPDFIVIYVGHNEYYGTISRSTGGNYYVKKMYLELKELKIFQLLFSLLSSSTSERNPNKTLMSKLSGKSHYRKDYGVDSEVARDYIRNLDEVVKIYSKNNIPVIIIEPVCNLYDMPPFVGDEDQYFYKFIKEYYQVYLSNNKTEMGRMFKERLDHPEFNKNANIVYLDSLYKVKMNSNFVLSNFIEAKDLDILPFRSRSVLIERLRKYVIDNERKYNNLYYIPLFDELTNRFGERIFGNQIFIDHVHFNMRGQLIVSQILTEKLAQIYKYDMEKKRRIKSIYENWKILLKKLYYTPLNEIKAYNSIASLVADSPFKEMLIPYHFAGGILLSNEIISNKEIFSNIIDEVFNLKDKDLEVDKDLKVYELILKYYKSKNEKIKFYEYLLSYFTLYPGSYWPYLLLARFYTDIANEMQLGSNFYEMAYLLSDKNEEIRKEKEACIFNKSSSTNSNH